MDNDPSGGEYNAAVAILFPLIFRIEIIELSNTFLLPNLPGMDDEPGPLLA
ncbi:MAG: hypothetical protein P8Z78_00670 [Gammaproteobacteria bacterium]|jgi:hypothetical protein